jgi:hypothetical protein
MGFPQVLNTVRVVDQGGNALVNRVMVTGTFNGPNPYTPGGFVLDLSARLSTIDSLDIRVSSDGGAATAFNRVTAQINVPTPGKATIKAIITQYLKSTATSGGAGGQPGGVTIAGASGALTTNEAAHTHDINHTHGAFVSGGASSSNKFLAGTTNNTWADIPHTHTTTITALGVTASGAGSAHGHAFNTLYDHTHSVTTATATAFGNEFGAVDLSFLAFGFEAIGRSN